VAILSDVIVDWTVSPRIVTVQAPRTTISIQDLYDTLRSIEDDAWNAKYLSILFGAGKDALGGGLFTGITLRLLNAVLEFEQRVTLNESGTVTTPDTTGVTLTDSAATFITNNVARGDIISNITDGSHATVLTVVSETVLTGSTLMGGTDNRWDTADVYDIFDVVSCTVDGGNLIAVDAVDAAIDPVFQTFGTHVTIAQATSAALLSAAAASAQGRIFVWPPT
jgi:hypothetical protein